jgi:hypothetical protein
MPNKDKNLLDEVNEYANLWNDSASWVTAPRAKVNISSNSKYKNKLQKLIDYHITDTAAHDAKAHGRWKPTANMNIKALDETADSAFLTFTETCYRGQAGIAEERMIDAFYDKQTKKFKILFFLNKKLTVRKEGAGFNEMMEELCFFFRSPKFGTPERQDLMEWVDKNGNKITTSSKATTTTSTKQHPLHWPYANRFAKIIEYHMRHTPGTRTLKKDIMKYVFQYEEQQTNGVILDVIAGIDDKEDYHIKVFHDRTTVVDTFTGNGYEKFLEALAKYMTLPINKQDPDYKNLLVESALTEFVDKSGQNIVLNSNNTAPKVPTQKTSTASNSAASPVKSTPTSQPPVKVTKPFKRKQVKNKFGCLIDDWRPEFNQLGLHIWDTCKKPADEKDSMVGPSILRIYFEKPNGEEWRLEVTNTGITLNKGLQVYIDWDYAISTYRNGTEVIISRGKTKDYNEFLDILLGLGIISDKKKCV